MYISSAQLLEAFLLAGALSLDAFVASFAYGSKKIKIPFKSLNVINFLCAGFTAVSLIAGTVLKQYLSKDTSLVISFTILFVLGLLKLMDGITKSFIRKHNNFSKEITFSVFNLNFILNLYANPEDADIDGSKTLSPAEAASLASALSLDSITVGLGAAVGNVNGVAVFLWTLIINMAALVLGGISGNTLADKTDLDLSWLSGIILILLAFSKLK